MKAPEPRHRAAPPPVPPAGLVCLFEDNHLLVLDKPAGLLTQAAVAGDDCLLERARADLVARYDKPGRAFVGLVHRLDRNVSGCIVLAKTSKAASRLSAAFRNRTVDKHYLALTVGAPRGVGPDGRAAIVGQLDGKPARMRLSAVCCGRGYAAAVVTLETGRKHQIRRQLAEAGAPLLGDPRYGTRSPHLNRPALHAWRLTVPHPIGGVPMTFEAPVPQDLLEVAAAFGLRWSEVAARKVC